MKINWQIHMVYFLGLQEIHHTQKMTRCLERIAESPKLQVPLVKILPQYWVEETFDIERSSGTPIPPIRGQVQVHLIPASC